MHLTLAYCTFSYTYDLQQVLWSCGTQLETSVTVQLPTNTCPLWAPRGEIGQDKATTKQSHCTGPSEYGSSVLQICFHHSFHGYGTLPATLPALRRGVRARAGGPLLPATPPLCPAMNRRLQPFMRVPSGNRSCCRLTLSALPDPGVLELEDCTQERPLTTRDHLPLTAPTVTNRVATPQCAIICLLLSRSSREQHLVVAKAQRSQLPSAMQGFGTPCRRHTCPPPAAAVSTSISTLQTRPRARLLKYQAAPLFTRFMCLY